MTPPIFIPATPRVRRKRRATQSPSAPLTLLTVEYFQGVYVTLFFERDIDIAAIVPGSISVADGLDGKLYGGDVGATLVAPDAVQVPLIELGSAGGTDPRMTVLVSNGIVAVDDGGTWVGVADLQVPYP